MLSDTSGCPPLCNSAALDSAAQQAAAASAPHRVAFEVADRYDPPAADGASDRDDLGLHAWRVWLKVAPPGKGLLSRFCADY
eukprot:SAG31_NODE_1379_length_8582_cov_17.482848_8_plen_82_part_00